MQPVQTEYTDTYEVPCPHECGVTVSIRVTRERGGRVLDLHCQPCPNALPGVTITTTGTARQMALTKRRE